jgi:glyoxylase I family protein
MGLPGLRGTEHIGFTVPDLDEAERFFVDIIGCQKVYSLGPFVRDDNWLAEQLHVNPRAVMRELRFFRCENGPNFEIFQWETPDPQAPPPKNSDLGGHHLAFYVDDIEEAVAYLRGCGVELMGDIVESQNASKGQRWIYFITPWGMQCELVSFPHGKAYEADSDVILWHPARPAE